MNKADWEVFMPIVQISSPTSTRESTYAHERRLFPNRVIFILPSRCFPSHTPTYMAFTCITEYYCAFEETLQMLEHGVIKRAVSLSWTSAGPAQRPA
jgi:hypothetical protein